MDHKVVTNLDEPLDKTGGNGARFQYRTRRIGPAIGLKKLGCAVYEVPPGKRGFPYHAHALIEELFIILEGSGTLRHEGAEQPLRAGDVVAAPVGQAHQIINSSKATLRYLAISANEDAEVCWYPDSNKVLAVSGTFGQTFRHMARLSEPVDYFDGEPQDTAPAIRAATEADAQAARACVHAAFSPYIERIGKPPAPMLLDFESHAREGHVWLAEQGTAVVGVLVQFETDEGFYIDTVASHPAARGTGVGKALLQFAESEARRRAYDSLYLCTNSKMVENQVLYPKIGYVEYDRKQQAGFDRVFYRKQLG